MTRKKKTHNRHLNPHKAQVVSFASELEESTMEQARQLATLPFIYPHVALMPDAHTGLGSSVGTVFGTVDAVIPAAVSVDISCGMIAVRTQFTAADLVDKNLVELRDAIEAAIPLSPGNYNSWVLRESADQRCRELAALAEDTGVDLGHSPKWRQQLGSLGGGNHFIELYLDEADTVWMFLHSGSRGVGNKIARKHIEIAQKLMAKWWIPLADNNLAYF